MLKIFLCEDNQQQRQQYIDILDKIVLMEDLDLELSYVTENPYALLKSIIPEKHTGIYFLDIDLNCDMNGLTLAQQIRKKDPRGFIVFITTHSEMSYMTFTYKVEAMDFIIKDNANEIKSRIFQCLLHAQELEKQNNDASDFDTFSIKIGSKIQKVPLEDILFFEAATHKIILHTKNGIQEFSGKLKDVKEMLGKR